MKKEIKSGFKMIIIIYLFFYLFMKEPFEQYVKQIKTYMIKSSFQTNEYQNKTMKQYIRYFDVSSSFVEVAKASKQTKTNQNQKKIYIYNTHQEEAYQNEGTVLDAAYELQSLLEEKGYEVVVEKRKIKDYLDEHQLTYNESYEASYVYLNDALKKDQYDLIIDFHRDSIDRNLSVITKNNTDYAKLMFVVGGSNDNYSSLLTLAQNLHQHIDQLNPGIMRSVMTREIAYYNQHVSNQMVLIEVGSDVNTYQEVQNSLKILAEGIDAYFKEKAS